MKLSIKHTMKSSINFVLVKQNAYQDLNLSPERKKSVDIVFSIMGRLGGKNLPGKLESCAVPT